MVKFTLGRNQSGIHNERQVAAFWGALGLMASIAVIAVLIAA
jgi:hypothetical protein